MSEEIKKIIYDIKDSLNDTPKNMYKYNKITFNLNELSEILKYVEQLEKENKELKYDCSCSFHDAEELNQKLKEIIDERNELDTKLIQLENIRIEAIKLIEEDILGKKIENVNWDYDECDYSDMPVERVKNLLSILNKGDNKE